eukprot:gene15111-6568_t
MVDAGFEVLWGQTLAAEPANLSAEVQCTFTAIAEPNARHAYPHLSEAFRLARFYKDSVPGQSPSETSLYK